MIDAVIFFSILIGIAALILWITWRGKKLREAEERSTQNDWQRSSNYETVIQDYGKFLEHVELGAMEIRDETELPYDKQTIIKACLLGIKATKDAPQLQGAIEASLLFLAQFQPAVGAPINDAATHAIRNLGAKDPGNLSNDELKELASRIASVGAQDQDQTRFEQFQELVTVDQNALMQMIQTVRQSA